MKGWWSPFTPGILAIYQGIQNGKNNPLGRIHGGIIAMFQIHDLVMKQQMTYHPNPQTQRFHDFFWIFCLSVSSTGSQFFVFFHWIQSQVLFNKLINKYHLKRKKILEFIKNLSGCIQKLWLQLAYIEIYFVRLLSIKILEKSYNINHRLS
jgi:hypothetical protein